VKVSVGRMAGTAATLLSTEALGVVAGFGTRSQALPHTRNQGRASATRLMTSHLATVTRPRSQTL